MHLELFCIRDSESNVFLNPFHATAVPVAIRQITAVLGDKASMLAQFPRAYQLYRLGAFNQSTGKLVLPAEPELICEITSLMPEVKNA